MIEKISFYLGICSSIATIFALVLTVKYPKKINLEKKHLLILVLLSLALLIFAILKNNGKITGINGDNNSNNSIIIK